MSVAEYICDFTCRGFTHLSSIARKRLVDGLCSNLSVLGLSIGALVSVQEPDDAAEHAAAATSHRSALTAYVFLLAWLLKLAEDEAKAAASTSDAKAGEKCQLDAHFKAHTQSLLPSSIAKKLPWSPSLLMLLTAEHTKEQCNTLHMWQEERSVARPS